LGVRLNTAPVAERYGQDPAQVASIVILGNLLVLFSISAALAFIQTRSLTNRRSCTITSGDDRRDGAVTTERHAGFGSYAFNERAWVELS